MKLTTRRIIVLAATIAVQLTLGMAYIWSAFQSGVAEYLFNGSQARAGLTFSLLLASLTISSVFGGKLAARFSTRIVVIVGGIIVSIGFFIAGFVRPEFGWLLWITYGVLGGAGMGFTYSTTIACTQKWFPHKKGLITGFVVAALGFGTVVFTPVVELLVRNIGGPGNGISYTFMVLSAIFLVVCVLGGAFMTNPPENYLQELGLEKLDCAECEPAKHLQEEGGVVAEGSNAPLADAVPVTDTTSETLSTPEFAVSNPSVAESQDCHACNKPTVYAHHPPVRKVKKVKQSEFLQKNLTSSQMLRTPYYYLITLAFLFAVIGGLMVINFARPIAVLRDFESVAFVAVFAIGLSNSGGRLLWGAVSDKFGRLNTIFVLLGSTAVLAPFIVLVPSWGVFVFIALIGLCYGGILAIFPALTAELFGTKNLATNYGFVLLGFGAGAVIASQIAGFFANTATYYQDLGRMLPAFLIAMGCAIVAAGFMLAAKLVNWRSKVKFRRNQLLEQDAVEVGEPQVD